MRSEGELVVSGAEIVTSGRGGVRRGLELAVAGPPLGGLVLCVTRLYTYAQLTVACGPSRRAGHGHA